MIQPIIDSLLENFQIAYNLHSTAVTDSHTKASAVQSFLQKHISHHTWLCLEHDRPFTAETAHDTALASSD